MRGRTVPIVAVAIGCPPRRLAVALTALVVALLATTPAWPQGSGLEAGITIMRDVPYRSATRLGWPALPFRVRTTPAPEVLGALDEGQVITRQITDLEAARITGSIPARQFAGGVEQSSSLAATIVRNSSRAAGAAGIPGIVGVGDIGTAAGAMVRSGTSGIASTIRGALGLPGQ